MKRMKKLVTLLLSLVMLCALAMPAKAAEPTYSITINGAVAGHTYTAYQVFKGVYYKGNRQVKEDEAEYLSDVKWGDDVDGVAIVTELKAPTTLKALSDKFASVNADDTDATAEKVAYILQGLGDKSEELDEFARVVGKHLTTTTAGTTNKVTIGTTNVKIDNLAAGYYFVKDSDSSAIGTGEIATKFLVEVVGNATVDIKADAPTIKKEIVNGDADNHTSANIGDDIDFKLTATVPDMANYNDYTFVIRDRLSDGLTFKAGSVNVEVGGVRFTDYEWTDPTHDKNEFAIKFTKEKLSEKLVHNAGAKIVVTYKATLNENALNKDVETNTAYLEYTNDPSGNGTGKPGTTPEAPVYVYDFDLTVDKFDGTAGTNNPGKKLKDAVFVLYKKDGTNKEYYKWNEASQKVEWVSEADNATATSQKTDKNGKATFKGLKEGTYSLEEITAPKGYNKLKDPVEVEIKATYNTEGILETTASDCKLKQDADNNGHYYQVQSIANKAGAVLPSTGGIGTTIFYVLGSIMALGAAVLLIAKKRMNGQER